MGSVEVGPLAGQRTVVNQPILVKRAHRPTVHCLLTLPSIYRPLYTDALFLASAKISPITSKVSAA